MVEAWWNAHAIEFIVFGALCALLGAALGLYSAWRAFRKKAGR